MKANPEHGLRAFRRSAAAAAALAALLLAACGPAPDGERYAAEKKLFKARKLREDLSAGGMREEFLAKALEGYRAIVREHGAAAADSVIGDIVVSAQIELAELEYRGGLLKEARGDFEAAAEIAKNDPAALANALYSAGLISEELGESARAERSYERLAARFLAVDSLADIVRADPRYLAAPLRLADLAERLGKPDESRARLGKAERLFAAVIERERNPELLREARHNLLAVFLRREDWKRALAFASELETLYRDSPGDVSSLLSLEASIHRDGLNDRAGALALYESIARDHPRSPEAPEALLAAAELYRETGRPDEARARYERILGEFAGAAPAVVEAQWQLARLEELGGDIEAAALRYRSIYAQYPETPRGFEAPLRIASLYRERGAADAAKAACDKALEHYEQLLSGNRSPETRLAAERGIIRALAEDARWRAAAERMTAIVERYNELGERERAIEVLEACAENYPGTELAGTALGELARMKR